MIKTMRQYVWWPNMADDVNHYVQSCDTCQHYKAHAQHTPARSTPIPLEPFQDVSMDVVGPVPNSRRGIRYVLTIQDRLSRWIEFAPMSDASADTTARTFLVSWICRFGVPKRLITDRGTNFMSTLLEEICEFLGIQHAPTTAYRPQGNAQNERSHKDLHSYLAMFLAEADAENWENYLAHAAWIHNSSYHESLQTSPFEVVTGLTPRTTNSLLPDNTPSIEQIEKDTLYSRHVFGKHPEKIRELRRLARLAIAKAQATTLERANKTARYPNLKIGQKVLKRRHVFRTFVDRKWNKKYDGPYTVLDVISPTIYKIQRDADSSYVDIVHASYLKPYNQRKQVSFSDPLIQYQTLDQTNDPIDTEPDLQDSTVTDASDVDSTVSDTFSDLTVTDSDDDNDDSLHTADSSFSSSRSSSSSSISTPDSTPPSPVPSSRPQRTAKLNAQSQISSQYQTRRV
jgi:transposase InsO family protein